MMKLFTLQGQYWIEWGKGQEAKIQLNTQPTRDGLPESNSHLLVQIKASLVISVLKQNPNKRNSSCGKRQRKSRTWSRANSRSTSSTVTGDFTSLSWMLYILRDEFCRLRGGIVNVLHSLAKCGNKLNYSADWGRRTTSSRTALATDQVQGQHRQLGKTVWLEL